MEDNPQEKEMSFLDHLDALRMHLIRSVIVLIAFTIGAFLAQNILFNVVLFGPLKNPDFPTYRLLCYLSDLLGLGDAICMQPDPSVNLIAIGMGEAFLLHIKVSFFAGLVMAFPYIVWEIWRFIKPGLYGNEKSATKWVVFVCSFLFIAGILFGYFVISPFAVNFLTNYELSYIKTDGILATSYINYMIMFTVPAGVIFELPVVVYYLAKLGIVTPAGMRKYRKHAFVGILVVAAVITPPDVLTQFLIGLPLYILYELSINIAAREAKKYEADLSAPIKAED